MECVSIFLDLPKDLQEKVFKCLDVHHRTRLNMVMPMSAKFTSNKQHDRKLSVLTSAIRKGRVAKLSRAMQDFLMTVPKWDPTLCEISQKFPEVNTIEYQETVSSLSDKLRDGKIDKKDVQYIMEMDNYSRVSFLAKCSPDGFQLLYEFDEIKNDWKTIDLMQFVFFMINCCNEGLLVHFITNPGIYGLNFNYGIGYYLNPDILKILTIHSRTREILFRHFSKDISQELLKEVYTEALEALDVDAMLFYERYMNTH
jgi:hypothetical protein